MELFTAGDESQWNVIKQWIDESDVYMLILGGRYGSIDKNAGISYTEMEYQYAMETQKPLFALVLKSDFINYKAKLPGVNATDVMELNNSNLLQDFRKLVESKMVNFCEDVKT